MSERLRLTIAFEEPDEDGWIVARVLEGCPSSRSNSLPGMRRVLVTGMSGAGKSTALAELARRGFQVVDTDEAPWSEWSNADGGYVWREDLVAELLSRDGGATLYVSGTVSNQGRLSSRFDAVVLLSAPVEVLLRRIETRTTNDYGKSAEERALIVGHVADVEPLLRASCTHEIDATQPIADVVAQLVEIGRGR
ncbi:MAG TPA: AAA family ATPase [Gaiellaceae bacterium]|nr:AAA family ATPase [Gaiellaceae bacterium]